MSEQLPHTSHRPAHEHGTMRSYVIGFMLSLIFTAIPYYLVVSHLATGTTLLVTMLVFAVLQMVVQVVFFLHLGRERKPYWQSWFLLATVGAILVVVGGSIFIMAHLHSNMNPLDESKQAIEGEGIYQIGGEKTGACQQVHEHQHIVIKDGVASPSHVDAGLCDTLTVTSEDATRTIVFGEPGQPESYAGEIDLTLYKGRPETFTLSQMGTHQFQDREHPETAAGFTVGP
jgi:cytochrome o ubiquinol oxidase operon protein cyoD